MQELVDYGQNLLAIEVSWSILIFNYQMEFLKMIKK